MRRVARAITRALVLAAGCVVPARPDREQPGRTGRRRPSKPCALMLERVPHLTDTDRAYLDMLAAWCRGDQDPRGVAGRRRRGVRRRGFVPGTIARIAQHRRTQAAIDARLRAVPALEDDLSMLVEAWQRAFHCHPARRRRVFATADRWLPGVDPAIHPPRTPTVPRWRSPEAVG